METHPCNAYFKSPCFRLFINKTPRQTSIASNRLSSFLASHLRPFPIGHSVARKEDANIPRRSAMSRESTSQFPNNPGDTLRDTASDVKETVSDFASQTKDKASQMASAAAESAGRQRESAAKGLHRAANAIHDNADKLPGRASQAAHKVAGGIDTTAAYLEEHNFSDMGKDVMDVCRRHPTEAIITSLALGFLVGRALRR
jgi:hypothetical protein